CIASLILPDNLKYGLRLGSGQIETMRSSISSPISRAASKQSLSPRRENHAARSNNPPRKSRVREQDDLFGGPAKVRIKELQETAEAQKAAVQRKRREADDRVPFVGFNGAIRDPQLDRRVSATNGAAADEM